MITDIIMRNCASYDSVGAQIANCAKINFIYGPNGSGKSTVSNFLRDPSNEMYGDSEIKWSLGDRSELIVYNRRFREANFGSCDIPGVFTLGEGAIEEIKKVEDLKNNRQKLVEERDKREVTKSREESKKLDRISLFRENIWALREKEHISFLRQAFAGYLNSKEKFMGEVLRRFELGIGTDINLEELKSGAEMLLGDKPEKSPKFATNFDEITSALLAVEVDSIWNTVVIGNEDAPIGKMIQALGNADWVNTGRKYIKAGSVCPFCQQTEISIELKKELDDFFSGEYELQCKQIASYNSIYSNLKDKTKALLDGVCIQESSVTAGHLDILQFEVAGKALLQAINDNLSTIKLKIDEPRGLKDKDVIAYQIRQSFKLGEIAPEEANRIGYETAMRWTKGKHAFIVATHVDKAHIHNHIVYNSTTLDATHKYQNFFLSSFALRRLSDMICLEHGMSVIPEKKPDQWQKRTTYPRKHSKRDDIRGVIDWIFENEKPKDMDEFLRFMVEHGFEIKRGKYISVKAEGQKNHLRLRSLGNGYTDDDIAKRIAGELVVDTGASKVSDDVSDSVALSDSEKKLDLVFDIQNIIAKQKGPGYERWAKVHNVKAISKTLLYLSEHGLKDFDDLSAKATEARDRFSYISSRQKEIETRMAEIKSLRQHFFNYSKSQDVFVQYKASGYSKEFFETHRDVLLLRNAAKEAFKKVDGKLPSVKALDEEFQELLQEKKELYAEYKPAKERMQELLMAKQNVERFLNLQEMQEQNFAKKKNNPSL